MPRRRGEGRKTEADDLEPVDLEPVDPEPFPAASDPSIAGARDAARRRADRRRVAWIAAAVAVVLVVGAVAVAGRHRGRAAAEQRATTSLPSTEQQRDPVRAVVLNLGRYWPGGEVIVMDGLLYVARARDASPQVIAGYGAEIQDQNGSSLLISTFPEQLVTTEPKIASHALSTRSVAIRAREPDEWWILRDDGSIRDTVTGNVLRPPAGLRIAAEVGNGFLALDVPHSRWVVWRGEPLMPTLAPATAQFLAAQGSVAVFRSNCSIYSCALELFDLAHGTAIDGSVPAVPEFASFSPTGSRLALASTLGDVFLMDPANGAVIARTRSRELPSLSSPLAWSTDGHHLIVVQQDSVEVRDATDGAVSNIVTGTAGLEQVAGLP